MDINFEFTIAGVPDEAVAESIRNGIENYLRVEHNTDMWITYEDVTK